MHSRIRALLALVAVCSSLAFAGVAQGFETHGVAASTFASGFTAGNGGALGNFGPLGVAVDRSNRVFVAEYTRHSIFRFDGPGQQATADHVLGGKQLGGGPAGLTMDGHGRLYVARSLAKDILEINPDTGAVVRTVVKNLCHPVGISSDPISGDLFVTQAPCSIGLLRIVDATSSAPKVVDYSAGFGNADGIVTAPDGTLFVVDEQSPEAGGGGAIMRVAGTGAAKPGERTLVTAMTRVDGLAVGVGPTGKTNSLIVSRNSGVTSKVDITTTPATVTDIVTGSDRGEDAAVGADGCFYASQQTSVLKITNEDGGCNAPGGLGTLAPTTPPAETGNPVGLPPAPSATGCLDRRKFTFKLHHGPSTTVTGVDVFVNGRRKVHTSGGDLKTVTLKQLPQKLFRVRIVATHSNGSRLVSTRRYKGCKKGHARTRGHRHG